MNADTLHCTVSSETFCNLNKRFLNNADHLQITHPCCVHDVKSVHECATHKDTTSKLHMHVVYMTSKSVHECATHKDTTPWTQSAAWSSVSWAQLVQQPNHLSTVGPWVLVVSWQPDSSTQRHCGQMPLCYQAALTDWRHSSVFQGHLQPENNSKYLLILTINFSLSPATQYYTMNSLHQGSTSHGQSSLLILGFLQMI